MKNVAHSPLPHPKTPQLPLDVGLRDGFSFASFVPGANQVLLDGLLTQARGQGELQMYLYGEAASGKTHLAQAMCHQAGLFGAVAACLDAELLLTVGTEALDGLDTLDVVCVDDLHQLCGEHRWEVALYNLINATRASGTRLVMTGRHGPHDLRCLLADLRSRILWGPVFQLHELSEQEKRGLLMERANRRGLHLAEDACDYLLRHCQRDLASLIELLNQLDHASLAAKRRLTVPFIREVLATSSLVLADTAKTAK